MRSRRGSRLRARLGFHDERGLARRLMHEADADAAVRLGKHLGRHVAIGELIAGGQHDGIAPDAERPIEHDRVALFVIALWILVRLDDADAGLAAVCWNRPREVHADVVRVGIGRRQAGGARFGAGDLVKLERLTGHHVVHGFVARLAAFPNGIEIRRRARGRRRHFVQDLERRRLRRQQLVLAIVVLLGLSRRLRKQPARTGDGDDEHQSTHRPSSTRQRSSAPRVSGIHIHASAAHRNAAPATANATPNPLVPASDPTANGAAALATRPIL